MHKSSPIIPNRLSLQAMHAIPSQQNSKRIALIALQEELHLRTRHGLVGTRRLKIMRIEQSAVLPDALMLPRSPLQKPGPVSAQPFQWNHRAIGEYNMYIRTRDDLKNSLSGILTSIPAPGDGLGFGMLHQGRVPRDQEVLRPERAHRTPPPTPTPPRKGRTFVTRFHPGVAHNHLPTGRWTEVQADAAKRCAQARVQLQAELSKGRHMNPKQVADLTEVVGTECSCAMLSPRAVLLTARQTVMAGMPLGQKHLDHYLNGGGARLTVDLADVIRRDAGVRAKLRNAIRASPVGHVKIIQDDYKVEDFRFAFGAIDRLDYEVDRAAGLAHVWFMDRYEWHPVGFGYKLLPFDTPRRVSNCAHAAAVELKASGAADYWMIGDTVVPLSLIMSGAGGGRGGTAPRMRQ